MKNVDRYDFNKFVDPHGTFSIRWEKYSNAKYKGKDILPMWVADSDFQTCPSVIRALQKRVSQGVFGYTLQPTPELTDAIVHHLDSCYDWQIEKDWIFMLPSLVSGLNLSCQIAGNTGDTVISAATIYPPFKSAPINAGRELLSIPMKLKHQRWVLDMDELTRVMTDSTRMLLFCNPHNPGGTVYTRNELKQLLSICKAHDVLICSDEIHCDLILDEHNKHIPLATLNDDAAQRTITLMAASKTFNIAGLNCGFAIVPDKTLRKRLRQSTQGLVPEINLLGQVATAVAFTECDDWMHQQNAYLRANRDYLLQAINSIPGLNMVSPQATFLAWIDVSGLELENPLDFFEEAGIGISPGKDFGDADFVRLNFACSRTVLEEAVRRIRIAVMSR